MQLQKTKSLLLTISVVVSSLLIFGQNNGEPGRDQDGPNPLKNVYFGEEHMHTRNSFDAFTVGVSGTWEDAYRFAMGEEIELSTTGEKMKRKTPYDFVTITDHSEYYGVLKDLVNPESPLSKTDLAKQLAEGKTNPDAAKAAVSMLIGSLVTNKPLEEFVTPELLVSNWTKFVETADKFYKPGEFTTLYGFEWTSIPDGRNMHRNVFFRETPPVVPFSSFNSIEPEDLWTYLEINRNQGIECFAIPHNSNVSNGWMFSEYKFQGKDGTDGGKIDERYARRQQENEPLLEMFQTKGGSETHPVLSPNDEFAGFEQFPNLINLGVPAKITPGAFVRQGLAVGLKIEDEVGYNPYKMGFTAGGDIHSAYQANEEWDWHGAHGNQDDTPEKRLSPKPNASGDKGYAVSSAGTTAVWATENTREAIFDAMKSKETYGTSGTLIRLRFFGGWGLDEDLVNDPEFVKKAYDQGVPMGQDLKEKPSGAKAPTFAVWAMKDPESGNLDRIQIIKVWADPDTKYAREKIYDVVWSDDREPDSETGQLPAVGNTVNVKNATYKNSIGDSQLSAVWTDPDFDPDMKAIYYVRVLEIPTPRWSTFDAVRLGVDPPKDVPASIQERAWSSPIWYMPAK
jgi:hypothetical protein